MKMKKRISIILIITLLISGLTTLVYGAVKEVSSTDLAVDKIVSAEGRTFFITIDGKVYGSGKNSNGILGLGNGVLSVDEATQIPITGVSDIETTSNATYYVMRNGDLYVSGVGLGQGVQYIPKKVEGVSGVKKIAVDGQSAMILNSSGEVYIYGDNSKGQLGAGNHSEINSLTKLSGIGNVVDVQMGPDYSVLLFNDGKVRAAGHDNSGMLGFNEKQGTYVKQHKEIIDGGQGKILQIAAGKDHIMYATEDNELWVTGATGELIGTENKGNNVKTITILKKFHDKIGSIAVDEIGANMGIGANSSLSFVLLENGELWVVGDDPYGASLDGTAGDRITSYKKVADGVMKFFVGGNQTFIGKKDANVIAAGYNMNSEIPDASTNIVLNPIVIDGMYYYWGNFNLNVPEEPEVEPVGDNLTEEQLDKLKNLDFDLIFNVARTGHKDVGKYLTAYQETLETIEHPEKNKSLVRVNQIIEILGNDYIPYLKYGTYNLYNDYRFINKVN